MSALTQEISRRAVAAQSMARLAGQSTLSLFQTERLQVDFKRDRSPVTEADHKAEQILRDCILGPFPQDSILGEELGQVDGTSGFRWVLDPIDGTKSFIAGVPLYGTMVGLEHAGDPVAGVIYFPGLDEIVYAARGEGCWTCRANQIPRRTSVGTKSNLSECTFLVTDVKSFAKCGAMPAYLALDNAALLTRSWGDCYGYYLVATGRADLMIDPILNCWDAVAAMPIIEEAGGRFCDWHGERRTDSGNAVAANEHLMPQVLEILRTV